MNANNKFVCIHGHFYQPPRENAWLEVVELQDSAAPFHDWNQRINFECYAPNTAARLLNNEKSIIKIINNYTRISFNFGPTLLSWMEKADPVTYQAILNADKISQARFGGHGSAMAQVYSHLIMPLANERDQETQVVWGIRDFKSRFGRLPEGMWLAETAANEATLSVLARNGLKFTVLAPRQAKSFRKIGEEHWRGLHEGFDPRRPYRCVLPSGESIVLFFYDGAVAQSVAFEGLLNDGKAFAQRFINAFDDNEDPQLVHIATDGESYGHHHDKGEMALADCLNHIEENNLATITNYGEYLEKFPPEYEVQIHDNSSWSCVHGIERWRSDCGCHADGHTGWNQAWRKPLRENLDWLRDQLIPIYEEEAKNYLHDPWVARNAYINVILDRSRENIQAFLERYAKKELSEKDRIKVLRLLEMQRNAILMYTSCGWFFDEISRIETNQILQYANRAIHYAKQIAKVDLHPQFIQNLQNTPSNVYANGAESYEKYVIPSRVDLVRVGMHYAASSIFEKHPEKLEFFNYYADSEVFERYTAGNYILALGRTTVHSKITTSQKQFSFVVLYLGQLNMIGNISLELTREQFDDLAETIIGTFQSSNLGEVINLMHDYFGSDRYTSWHLFRDQKHRILELVTEKQMKQVETTFREIYKDNYQLMLSFLKNQVPIPQAYMNAVQFTINHDLVQFFANGALSIRDLKHLASERKRWSVKMTDESAFKLAVSERIFKELKRLKVKAEEQEILENLINVLKVLDEMEKEVEFWKSQNLYFSLLKELKYGEREFPSEKWRESFLDLGKMLKVSGW